MASLTSLQQETLNALRLEYFALRLDRNAPQNHFEASESAKNALSAGQRDLLKGYNLQAFLRDQYLAIVYAEAFKTLKEQSPGASNEDLHDKAIGLLKGMDDYGLMAPDERTRFSQNMLQPENLIDMQTVCLPSESDPKVDEGLKTFRRILRQASKDKDIVIPPDCSDSIPYDPRQAVHDIVLGLQNQRQIRPDELLKGIHDFLKRPDVHALDLGPAEMRPALAMNERRLDLN